MAGDAHAARERKIIVLTPLLIHIVQHVGEPVSVPLVGDHADMLDTVEHDDVALLPLRMIVDIVGEGDPVFAEEHVEHPGTAKVDVGVGFGGHRRIGRAVRGDVRIDHGLEVVSRVPEGAPHHIDAGAAVGGRVSALVVAVVVCRVRQRILAGPAHDVRIVVHTVAVEIHRAGQHGIPAPRHVGRHHRRVGLSRVRVHGRCLHAERLHPADDAVAARP